MEVLNYISEEKFFFGNYVRFRLTLFLTEEFSAALILGFISGEKLTIFNQDIRKSPLFHKACYFKNDNLTSFFGNKKCSKDIN